VQVPSIPIRFRTLAAAFGVVIMAAWGLAQARRPYQPVKHGANYLHNYALPPAPSAFPWAATWAPDGKALAYAEMGSIWVLDLASGEAREVAASSKYLGMPKFSPDGRFLVHTADDGGKTIELEVTEVATGKTTPLTDFQSVTFDPAFSQDGTKLAYTSARPLGYLSVFVQGFENGALKGDEIQINPDTSTTGSERPYFLERDMTHSPVFIPGAADMLAVSNRGVSLGSGVLRRTPVAPGSLQAGPGLIDEQTLHQLRPDVSPDGKMVAYASARGGSSMFYRIFTGPLAGGVRKPVTPDGYDSFFPRFSPDGTRLVFLSNEGGTPALRILEASGRIATPGIARRMYRRPMATLKVRTTDLEGRPLAARVGVLGADGKSYAPAGAYSRLSWAGDRVFHGFGESTLTVPAGRVVVDVVRGFETEPVRSEIELAADEQRTVEIRLKPLVSMAARGWHGGSTGFHLNPGGFLKYDLKTIVDMAEAEDVAVINRPFPYRDPRVQPGDLWARGEPAHPVSRPGRLLLLGQEERPPFFGHIAFFGTRKPLETLPPVFIGYEPPANGPLTATNADVLAAMKKAGAYTSYVHAFSGEADPMTQGLGTGKGLLMDAALGHVDTLEWSVAGRGSFVPWYAALNNGLRVTAVGGEDTISNLAISKLMGCIRTYAKTGKPQAEPTEWWDAVRAGKAFVSTGPLVDLEVNGAGVGDEVRLDAPGEVRVKAWVRSIVPLSKVLLVVDGAVIQELPLSADRKQTDWTGTLPVSRSGWIHLRAEGAPAERAPLDALFAQAFTNPIWLTVADKPVRNRAAAEYALRWIETFRLMAEVWPKPSTDTAKARLAEQIRQARAVYQRFSDEAGPSVSPEVKP